jgi:hypothetical protein
MSNKRKRDEHGHATRMSDSSLYDEKCVYCGATDGSHDDRLEKDCPHKDNPNPEERY